MSKGIIITETGEIPKTCYECNQTDDMAYCKWVGIYVDHWVKPDEKYSCCPIQPMPEKKYLPENTGCVDGFNNGYRNGWNDCKNAILGGSDE